jgi:hypothetical protein
MRIVAAIIASLAGLLPAIALSEELLPAERVIEEVVDHYIEARLAKEGITPAPPAGDANLVRRLTLDLVGRVPTVAEVKAYVESGDPQKRTQLVERLMASSGFVRYQAYELDALLMAGYRGSLREYLTAALGESRSWDTVFRELLLEKGVEASPTGAMEFLRTRADDPDKMANDVSVLFFGVNISCAKCHDHPLVEDWKQDHFYGMRSFFSRTFDNGGFLAERGYGVDKFRNKAGEEKTARLMFLTGTVLEEPEAKDPTDEEKKKEKQQLEELKKQKKAPPPPEFSRRAQLIDVALQSGEDRFLARALVNRVWLRLFGHGLVMPADQMHSANPPSHPELLDWLARDFSEHGYDLRRLFRGLVASRAYARSSLWEQSERPRPDLFAVANLRPLTPQQYSASLRLATADSRTLPGLDQAAELEKQIESIDNSARGFANELEMPGESFQVGVSEALLFANSDRLIKDFLTEGKGRLISHMLEQNDPRQRAETAVWSILTRAPEPDELDLLADYLARREDRPLEACRQLVWALLASSEFRFNY